MKRFVLSAIMFLALVGLAFAIPGPQDSQPEKVHKHVAPPSSTQDSGEEIFKAHCQRCHTPPSGIPQRITGTVIMHMRVRARLSRRDEQLLLKYMAP